MLNSVASPGDDEFSHPLIPALGGWYWGDVPVGVLSRVFWDVRRRLFAGFKAPPLPPPFLAPLTTALQSRLCDIGACLKMGQPLSS